MRTPDSTTAACGFPPCSRFGQDGSLLAVSGALPRPSADAAGNRTGGGVPGGQGQGQELCAETLPGFCSTCSNRAATGLRPWQPGIMCLDPVARCKKRLSIGSHRNAAQGHMTSSSTARGSCWLLSSHDGLFQPLSAHHQPNSRHLAGLSLLVTAIQSKKSGTAGLAPSFQNNMVESRTTGSTRFQISTPTNPTAVRPVRARPVRANF